MNRKATMKLKSSEDIGIKACALLAELLADQMEVELENVTVKKKNGTVSETCGNMKFLFGEGAA